MFVYRTENKNDEPEIIEIEPPTKRQHPSEISRITGQDKPSSNKKLIAHPDTTKEKPLPVDIESIPCPTGVKDQPLSCVKESVPHPAEVKVQPLSSDKETTPRSNTVSDESLSGDKGINQQSVEQKNKSLSNDKETRAQPAKDKQTEKHPNEVSDRAEHDTNKSTDKPERMDTGMFGNLFSKIYCITLKKKKINHKDTETRIFYFCFIRYRYV